MASCGEYIYSGINYVMQLKLSVLPEASRCSEGSAGSLPLFIFLNGRNIGPTFCTPCDRFRTPAMKYPSPWSWVCTGPHCKHTSLVSSTVFNNNLSLLIYGCMCIGMLGHIPRYMGRMSNNNNMLINNLSCYFAIRVVYTQITVKWGIRCMCVCVYGVFLFGLFLWRTCLMKP